MWWYGCWGVGVFVWWWYGGWGLGVRVCGRTVVAVEFRVVMLGRG